MLRPLASLLLTLVVLLTGCIGERRAKPIDTAYVAVPQVTLRDRLAPVYNKVGTVKNGERVEILERQRRFARVRAADGREGWVEQRFLVSQEVFDGFQRLAQEHASDLPQGHALARGELNMHLTPGRESAALYRLAEQERVALLQRATAERPNTQPEQPPVVEDWWLVRNQQGRAGWVLGRRIDVDVPLEIAQYAEGQRIVTYFVLNEVEDDGRKIPQALLAFTDPRDGMPYDFNQIRVFTWNRKRDRYETAYRERRLAGQLPIEVGRQSFEREGELPTFTIRSQDAQGNLVERKYKLNGPIVRRVAAPGPPAS